MAGKDVPVVLPGLRFLYDENLVLSEIHRVQGIIGICL